MEYFHDHRKSGSRSCSNIPIVKLDAFGEICLFTLDLACKLTKDEEKEERERCKLSNE